MVAFAELSWVGAADVAGQAHVQEGQTLQLNHLASCIDWLMIIKANVCMEVAAQHAIWPYS